MEDWWKIKFPQGQQRVTITDATGQEVAIAYAEKGTGKPLVLVHGFATWSYSWRCNIDLLSQHFRVICFDAKGYGFSEKPAHPETPGHQVPELAQVIRALCDEPVVLVAESLGALTSLAVAETYPELVAQLVLLNVPIFPKQLPSWGMRLLSDLPLEFVRTVDQLRLAKWVEPLVHLITRIARYEVVADPSLVTSEEVYWLTYPYLELPGTLTQFAEDAQQSADEIRRFLQNQPNLISPIQQNLGAIACPTLILWGEKDNWFPVADGKQLSDRIPHAKLQVIPNCGHCAAGSGADTVNLSILSFLLDPIDPIKSNTTDGELQQTYELSDRLH